MLKKAETEEIRLFCHVFIIGDFSIMGGGGTWAPLATPMVVRQYYSIC